MSELIARAQAAARSARLLLDEGDSIGALNRAYYAMFDLARAALRDLDPRLAVSRKHATIIARFSKHFVQERGLPPEFGRALRRAFDARLVSDYSETVGTPADAKEIVDSMDRFVAGVTKIVRHEC